MIGKTLGTFECTALLGKGGMGEVYRAKDQKLGRDVAIKVLPKEFAKDSDRVARFQREAKLLASLNHNNIASIYGLEESDGTHFLVLELIEGDTLADRLKRGAIPAEESLKLALQIAEALEAAHEKGVIHRDLKPANIKVTPEGKVKVLDFGLAKAFAGDSEDINLSNSPTLSVAATQQGIILGTAAYMSPEQASGEAVDKRTDIWAFGVVMFEMLAGRSLFEGNNVSQTLASVIKSEPEWKSLPPNLHPRARLLLERCLKKEPKDRYSGISDARVDIQEVLVDPSGLSVQTVAAVKSRNMLKTTLAWVAAIILAAIIAGVAVWKFKPTEQRYVKRYYHELSQDQRFTRSGELLTAVSADGTKIAYVANNQLYLRNLDKLTALPIQGTNEDPANPFFSPDGQSIGYYSFAASQWKKISVSGGASVKLCDAPDPNGATWGADGTILFAQKDGVIMSVSANGGTAKPLIEAEEGEQVYGPQALPGGEWVLFTLRATRDSWDEAQIVVQSVKTGERKALISGGSDARYLPTGHIVYALGGDLLAFAFDIEKMGKKGGEAPIVEEVQRALSQVTGAAQYGFSDTGMLAYVVGTAEQLKRSLVWVDREGKEEPIAAQPDTYYYPRISPDGTRLALAVVGEAGNVDIHILDLDREGMMRLTFDKAGDRVPIWTPDGKRIVFSSDRGEGSSGIYSKASNGTGAVENLCTVSGGEILPYSWSKDGNTLLIQETVDNPFGIDIGALSMEGDPARTPLLQEEFLESQPQISPDGRWIAYMSNELKGSSEFEIYVRPFPDVDKGKWHVSTSGGMSPLWSPDGTELFYRSGDAVISVSLETEPTFKTGKSEVLFEGRYIDIETKNAHSWDISPDGKRFLMIKEYTGDTATEVTSRPRINIVLNWFEELKEKVPTD